MKAFIKNGEKNYFYVVIISIFISGCYMSTPDPIVTNIGGKWQWIYTYRADRTSNEQPSASLAKFLSIDPLPYTSEYDQVLRFSTNGVQTDSLFRQITHNSSTPSISDEKRKIVYATVVDGNGKMGVVRFQFFKPKGKLSPDRMRINIQLNTDVYNPEADTLEMEYIALFPR
jgi:hypothetical protein